MSSPSPTGGGLALIAIFRSVSDFAAAFCERGIRKVAFFLEVNTSVENRFRIFSVSPFDRIEKIQSFVKTEEK
jgi:hypothetical protein